VNSGRVDLHIHSSKSSDGDFEPLDLLRKARENGFRAIAIADHDTVDAYPEAIGQSLEVGVELIPSVELTTVFRDREFHLLLPFVRYDSPAVKAILGRIGLARTEEAKDRVARLRELGFDIGWDEIVRDSGGALPLGVTIARILIDKCHRENNPALDKYRQGENRKFGPYAFYRDYFMEGRPAHVPRRSMSLLDILPQALADGAVPVLAHPGADFAHADKTELTELKAVGLAGLEVYSSYHDREKSLAYLALAEELDLVPTAGSDFHGRIKPHVAFGSMRQGDYSMVEALRARRRLP
jgi:3',5'-nucleoside bisphosphate phosphatase